MSIKSPNYTQTPNELFDVYMPEMEKAELKVYLLIVRETFGYRRNTAKLSTVEIARRTGLSEASVLAGGRILESMGLVRKITDGKRTAIWEAIVDDGSEWNTRLTTSTVEADYLNRRGKTTSTVEGQSGVKENRKLHGRASLGAMPPEHEQDFVPAPPRPRRSI
jgi:hypothetical protein